MGKSEFVRMRKQDLSGKSGSEIRRNPGNHFFEIRICPDAKSGKIRICLLLACCSLTKHGFRAFSDACIRSYPDVSSRAIRATTSGQSEFVRIRKQDLSRKCGCEIRRNHGNHIGAVRICQDRYPDVDEQAQTCSPTPIPNPKQSELISLLGNPSTDE